MKTITSRFSVILPNYNKPADRFTSYGAESHSVFEQIELCSQQKIATGVETLMMDGSQWINEKNSAEVKTALDAHGLTLCSLIPYTFGGEFIKGSLGSNDAKIRRNAIDLTKRTMDLAAQMSCPYVGQWPGQDGWDYHFEADYVKMYDHWVSGMQELADHNPAIKLGLEPKPYEPRAFSFLDTTTKALLLINDIDRKNVGVCLDVGHALYGHANPAECVALAQHKGNRLFHLHMNDNYAEADWDMPFGSVRFLAWIELFHWLQRTGFEGWHSVDIFAYRTNPRETILECLKWMELLHGIAAEITPAKLDALIKEGDGIAVMKFFREAVFSRAR